MRTICFHSFCGYVFSDIDDVCYTQTDLWRRGVVVGCGRCRIFAVGHSACAYRRAQGALLAGLRHRLFGAA